MICDACNAWGDVMLKPVWICSCCDDLADIDLNSCKDLSIWGEVCPDCYNDMHTKEEEKELEYYEKEDFILICKCGLKMRNMGFLDEWFDCECGMCYDAELDVWG